MQHSLHIRKAKASDYDQIWVIIQEVIAHGDTYVFDPNTNKNTMLAFWCGPDKYTYVAEANGKVVGSFFIKANQPDLGSHVANAGYMTLASHSGQGIGKAMCEHSLEEARKLGFDSMQFNMVIKNNKAAIHLWQKLGFEIVGEIPRALKHSTHEYLDAYIMWRKL